MGFRITTWNVNGIRNPFGYQPWREKRSFDAMFDILETDIVVFQETKIQRKDLQDDMVLVPGWDCYFSLPKHKKGYSGVVIYTRNSKCAPIRTEQGITGIICPPNSSTPFRDLPEEEQIGGYPTAEQLGGSEVDPVTLDSEGRCVILEFPAFVLLGVYCPANRDETREAFRLGFLDALDARVRNLVAMGKRVILTGDINISMREIDSAHCTEAMRTDGITEDDFVSAPARRMFNHLVSGGKVVGDLDEGRENPVLWDICRSFHPERRRMYTCWEQRVNARPGNYGATIDYVLCSMDMKDWFEDSNIQEGLMGSDHCPVYATFKDKIELDNSEVNLLDIMNPKGMFENGERIEEYSTKNILPLSGRLIPEFDRRRNIKDMFFRKLSSTRGSETPKTPKTPKTPVSDEAKSQASETQTPVSSDTNGASKGVPDIPKSKSIPETVPSEKLDSNKRSLKSEPSLLPLPKRSKSNLGSGKSTPAKGQQNLKGLFTPKQAATTGSLERDNLNITADKLTPADEPETPPVTCSQTSNTITSGNLSSNEASQTDPSPREGKRLPTTSTTNEETSGYVIDPIVSKESWSKIFTKKAPPRCEDHDETCIKLVTRKPGMNQGRSFWMCSRPLGPSGKKENGTEWRCFTFIWCSDWNGPG